MPRPTHTTECPGCISPPGNHCGLLTSLTVVTCNTRPLIQRSKASSRVCIGRLVQSSAASSGHRAAAAVQRERLSAGQARPHLAIAVQRERLGANSDSEIWHRARNGCGEGTPQRRSTTSCCTLGFRYTWPHSSYTAWTEACCGSIICLDIAQLTSMPAQRCQLTWHLWHTW